MNATVYGATARSVPRSGRVAVAYTFGVSGALTGSWAPRIPQIKTELGLGTGALGVALLALAAGALVAMPLAGTGVARWGSRRVTRALLVAFCLLAGGVGLAWSLWSLWLVLFCWGATVGALDVAMNSQGVRVERAYRRPVLSSFHAAFSAGTLLGAGLGSVAAALGTPVGWQQLALGLVLLAGWPLTRAFLVDEGLPAGSPGPAPLFALPSGRLLLLGLGAFGCMLCEGAASDWSAVQLRESLGASPGVAGSGFVAFALTMTAGRMVGDRITTRLGRVRTVRAFTLLGAVGLAAGLGMGTVAGAVVGFCLLGVGLSCVVPVLFGAAGEHTGATGPAIAAVATCGYLGWMLGPAIVGGLAHAVGLSAALWLLPVLTATTGVLAFAAREPRTGPR